jgi:pilus assembly protein Flp/PilA
MKIIRYRLAALLNDESGQDLIEYALIAAIIALGAITTMTGLSNNIGSAFSTVGSKLTTNV